MKNFLVGFGIGFSVGMLVAPMSGEKTRRQLRDSAGELFESTREQARRIARDPQAAWDNVRERASSAVESVANEVDVEKLRRQATELIEDAREHISRLTDVADEATSWLNQATREDLMGIYGIGPVLADRIMESRPYYSLSDLMERGVVSEVVVQQLRRDIPNLKRTA